ncbi:peptidyl-prolyl cis-trans isomerase FKBP16-chloroplastic isoform X2 [Micractinium conductrix]|uniref:peptidylprolyl isomerase n=1 Tax=Micractinium conductrix TaxID=554055 RepID=A0A2P6VIM4_9CHLO|nr:peptidyl-prolyl cis-trans isomerase FKBP16-chloroplastic isoform X2 [Micractinium conductrix]|eukprot:PSC73907.1 peptidyl-prolyl cis-trans isomerase FKBP16-chloroplastic isoform X2 [Micractinium conductrix]
MITRMAGAQPCGTAHQCHRRHPPAAVAGQGWVQRRQQQEQQQQRQQPAAHPTSRRDTLGLLAGSIALLASAPVPSALAAGGGKATAVDGGDWSSPGLSAPVDPNQPKFFKTDSGVRVQVLAEGSGPAAAPGDAVLVDFVLRRSNGYFIYGTVDGVSFQPKDVPVGPVPLKLGDGSVVPGLEDVLVGARPGSKFRALVPPEMGYATAPGALPQMPTFATQRQLENHKSEPLLFEVQLLRVAGVKR